MKNSLLTQLKISTDVENSIKDSIAVIIAVESEKRKRGLSDSSVESNGRDVRKEEDLNPNDSSRAIMDQHEIATRKRETHTLKIKT